MYILRIHHIFKYILGIYEFMPVEFKIKVVKVGNSLRITIPKEIAEAIKLKVGDVVGISLDNSRIIIRKISKNVE